MKKFFLLGWLSVCVQLNAQSDRLDVQSDRAYGQVIVQLAQGTTPDVPTLFCGYDLRWERALAQDWQVHLYSFDERFYSATEVVACLKEQPHVEDVQLNRRTEDRAIPNDTEWFRQVSTMSLIKAPDAWDITTGGLTPQGDTIVVAVLERGYYREHPDYQSNRWYNHLEIPDNNIDDDQNGYVDDYRGWNPRTLSDFSGPIVSHGTSVTGIVGAHGNNATGVAGVNWRVKLMNLSNVEYESEIIAAYYYVHNMRKLYNTSGKKKGAFVVASNASFGFDRELAADHKMWCNAYDSLGVVGVVSVAATTNLNLDVDVEGDMPTQCASPYLITVTNVNAQDIKQTAGYGKVSIDIGAPGAGTFTTSYSGGQANYQMFGGTSSAAPHVTGAVALIYSLPCAGLAAESVTQPNVVAERVRDLILENLDANPTLLGITKYGGRVNLFKPLQVGKVQYCNSGFNELNIDLGFINVANRFKVRATLTNDEPHYFMISNILGQVVYEEVVQQSVGLFSREIPTEFWASGVYFASIRKGKQVATLKFLKI